MNRPDPHASNLAVRVATAAVGIPLVLVVNRLGGVAFACLIALVAAVAAWECSRLLARTGMHPLYIFSLPAAVSFAALPVATRHPQAGWIGVSALLFAALGGYYLLPHAYATAGPTWLYGLFPPFYAGLLLGHLHLLRYSEHGAWWVFLVLVMTWMYDTGAYAGGSLLGRHPFMQHVSPKKTFEGVAGGLLLSTISALAGCPTIGLAVWQALLLGVAMGIVAQLGDLIESMLKRQTGVKDSGVIIPGHGGLLDRIDSLLLTGVLGYYASALLGHAT